MNNLSLKCQVPILIGASAFGYFFASKSHHYWYKACEEDRLIEEQHKVGEQNKDGEQNKVGGGSEARNSKLHHYINTGIGCVGAAISSKVTYDVFLRSSS